MPRLLFYVNSQHGLGHYRRVANILTALEQSHPRVTATVIYAGVSTTIFDSSGRTNAHRLPGLESHFAAQGMTETPFACDHRWDTREVLAARRRRLDLLLRDSRFDVVVLEYFPFARQYLADEVRFILGLVRSGPSRTPVVCISVRDYVTLGALHDRTATEQFLKTRCDYVLVHSDPAFARLEDSYEDPVHQLRGCAGAATIWPVGDCPSDCCQCRGRQGRSRPVSFGAICA